LTDCASDLFVLLSRHCICPCF